MCCDICGTLEESDIHVLFVCPLAKEIWGKSGFEEHLWEASMPTVIDKLVLVSKPIDGERIGEFMAVIWEIWNERNRLFFL